MLLMSTVDVLDQNKKAFHLPLGDAGVRIPNHFTPALSAIDLEIVHAVPPGGNWKDIPESVPSRRLTQIRES
jgi:hypothetical protein